jgi:hypothetical protein
MISLSHIPTAGIYYGLSDIGDYLYLPMITSSFCFLKTGQDLQQLDSNIEFQILRYSMSNNIQNNGWLMGPTPVGESHQNGNQQSSNSIASNNAVLKRKPYDAIVKRKEVANQTRPVIESIIGSGVI